MNGDVVRRSSTSTRLSPLSSNDLSGVYIGTNRWNSHTGFDGPVLYRLRDDRGLEEITPPYTVVDGAVVRTPSGDAIVIITDGDDGIYRSTVVPPSGGDWKPVSVPVNLGQWGSYHRLVSNGEVIYLLVRYNDGRPRDVMRSDDGGASWTVEEVPSSLIAIGYSNGFFHRTHGGSGSWWEYSTDALNWTRVTSSVTLGSNLHLEYLGSNRWLFSANHVSAPWRRWILDSSGALIQTYTATNVGAPSGYTLRADWGDRTDREVVGYLYDSGVSLDFYRRSSSGAFTIYKVPQAHPQTVLLPPGGQLADDVIWSFDREQTAFTGLGERVIMPNEGFVRILTGWEPTQYEDVLLGGIYEDSGFWYPREFPWSVFSHRRDY